MRRGFHVFVIIIGFMLILTMMGCSYFQYLEDPENEQSSPLEEKVEIKEPTPVREGSLRILMPMNLSSTNPLLVESKDMVSIFSLIFEGLMQYDENLVPKPHLAEAWEASPDGKSWIFHLRKGIYWHKTDKEFTAKDVIFTLDFLTSEDTNSIYKKSLRDISSYKALDDYTVEVKTKTPSCRILASMTFPVLPAHYYRDKLDKADVLPVGTGPYQVEKYEKMRQMTLTSNTKWWKEQPYIPTIILKAMPDNETALAAYEAKELDIVPTGILTAGKYEEAGDTKVHQYLTQHYEFLAPQFDHPFLKDKRVRQAIAYAIDKKEIISKVYLNHAVAVDVPIPPDSWLYDSKWRRYDHNIKEAQRLLEEAGWKDRDGDKILEKKIKGKTIKASFTLYTNDNPENPERKEAATFIRDQLLDVGIDVKIKVLTWDELLEAIESQDFDMILSGYFLDHWPDLSFAFHSGNIESGSNINAFSNQAIDQILQESSGQNDLEGFREQIQKLQEKLADELPYISLYFRTGSLIAREKVHGIHGIREMDTYHGIEQWFISE
ncbi:MAG: ABC transporter substrate-binding protein [Clostridia bacterium]|jgi:peptide/nickel transport system substrate-binding protein